MIVPDDIPSGPLRQLITAVLSSKIDHMSAQLLKDYDDEGIPLPVQIAVLGITLQIACLKSGQPELIRKAAEILLEGADKIETALKEAGTL